MSDFEVTPVGTINRLAALEAEVERLRERIREDVKLNHRLMAEVERLREALTYMPNVCPPINAQGEEAHQKARAALEAEAERMLSAANVYLNRMAELERKARAWDQVRESVAKDPTAQLDGADFGAWLDSIWNKLI